VCKQAGAVVEVQAIIGPNTTAELPYHAGQDGSEAVTAEDTVAPAVDDDSGGSHGASTDTASVIELFGLARAGRPDQSARIVCAAGWLTAPVSWMLSNATELGWRTLCEVTKRPMVTSPVREIVVAPMRVQVVPLFEYHDVNTLLARWSFSHLFGDA
jgi:hypothetical protein